ncbi:hypothetical protein ONS95_001305 [Cadophora gregata]|uniref:uncharacterized protein n=1 Tax=Cadophora gregata TaxID=51156 RepID=UPI0026DCC3FA|nr:uncharacterized protein ONS95_001305 [Cadophora gregata]KAK0101883.1 hypothetical protein ONS96_005858 [Cadophora gregata f. sp. sojae]KAK0129379.1 hypothetical protein ONS95_001305 [Cadophora gregata]
MSTWIAMGLQQRFMAFMNSLSALGVRELYIVVDKGRDMSSTDLNLLTQKPFFEELLPDGYFDDSFSALTAPVTNQLTWESLEDMHMKDIAMYEHDAEKHLE